MRPGDPASGAMKLAPGSGSETLNQAGGSRDPAIPETRVPCRRSATGAGRAHRWRHYWHREIENRYATAALNPGLPSSTRRPCHPECPKLYATKAMELSHSVPLPPSVTDLLELARRARGHAAAFAHDEIGTRLLTFAEELEARAEALLQAGSHGGAATSD